MANELSTQRKNFLSVVQGDGFKKQLALAVPRHLNPDRVLRIALTVMNKNPKLYDCDQSSVLGSIMDASQLGLECDNRAAYLVPFNDKRRGLICQLIIGYQGFIELAYRHPLVKGIRAKAVYDKDHFEYDEGLVPKLEHRPYDGDDDAGKLKFAYAICNLEGGGFTFVVLNRRQVMKAKAFSRGSDSSFSPWQTSEEAMWVKTAVRALAKFMPRSTELTQAIMSDDENSGAVDIAAAVIPSGNVGQRDPLEDARNVTPLEDKPDAPTEPEEQKGPDLATLQKVVTAKCTESNISKSLLVGFLVVSGKVAEKTAFGDIPAPVLDYVANNWVEVVEGIRNA